jgi:chorismate synthase
VGYYKIGEEIMLRFLTAGESHGKALVGILDGMPAGLTIDAARLNHELKRRQAGFGRGKRMQIEPDTALILSGVKNSITLGSPLCVMIENVDSTIEKLPRVDCPRPGHADLPGLLKYGFDDARNVLERASARETAMRVAIGALCKMLLHEFNIKIISRTVSIQGESDYQGMREKVYQASAKKDTVGGIFEVTAKGVPVGLGTYAQPDRRLDARIAQGIMSIPGIKALEFGLGFGYADRFGSEAHDAIYYTRAHGYFRKTNNAGGIEGGISNGEDIRVRACMKPISTLRAPLDSVKISTKKPAKATVERSDICVVESAGVIAESAMAQVLADAFLEKFGCDSVSEIQDNYANYLKKMR